MSWLQVLLGATDAGVDWPARVVALLAVVVAASGIALTWWRGRLKVRVTAKSACAAMAIGDGRTRKRYLAIVEVSVLGAPITVSQIYFVDPDGAPFHHSSTPWQVAYPSELLPAMLDAASIAPAASLRLPLTPLPHPLPVGGYGEWALWVYRRGHEDPKPVSMRAQVLLSNGKTKLSNVFAMPLAEVVVQPDG